MPMSSGGAAARAASSSVSRTADSKLATAHRVQQIADFGVYDHPEFVGAAVGPAAGNPVAQVAHRREGLRPLRLHFIAVEQRALQLRRLQDTQFRQGAFLQQADIFDGVRNPSHEAMVARSDERSLRRP